MFAQLKVEYEQETHAPLIDNLTRLFNYEFCQVLLAKEFTSYQREGKNFSLSFIDIDLFSLYNKKLSSLKEDLILKGIAQIVHEHAHHDKWAARLMAVVNIFDALTDHPYQLLCRKKQSQRIKNVHLRTSYGK